MLQPSVAIVAGVEHEYIPIEGHLAARLFAVPKANLGLTDSLRVRHQLGDIKTRLLTASDAGDDQLMRDAVRFELAAPKIADGEGAVGKGVVAVSFVGAKTTGVNRLRRQCSRGPPQALRPVGRFDNGEAVGHIRLAKHLQANARGIEKCPCLIKVSSAD